MSVIIAGVKMPRICTDCPCNNDYVSCGALDEAFIDKEGFRPYERRLPNCPLIDLDTPEFETFIEAFKMSDRTEGDNIVKGEDGKLYKITVGNRTEETE